jgi:predicted nucleic acid-binding protein
MPSAVSDSSVLIHLGVIGMLELLPRAFEEVYVPPAVWKEVVRQGRSRQVVEAVEEAARAGWILVRAPANTSLVQSLRQTLHEGEAEAISLAVETRPDFLLMDESDGREIARRMALKTHGVVGLLVQAKADGRLTAVRPVIEQLVQSGFYLAPALVEKVLREVGETP